MSNNIAIIIARGGSKRIPRKNIKDFCGQPIIKYSIDTAINANIFKEVMVSTDDLEIAALSKKFGASVPFMRSKKNSDDYSTTSDVLEEVLERYAMNKKIFDNICCIYPTAPFITKEKLVNSMDMLKKFDSVIPVVKFSFPLQRSFFIDINNNLKYKWSEFENSRSQDLEDFYHDSGQFYCIRVNKFLQYRKLVIPNTYPFIVSALEVQDIDNIDDWELAEIKYLNMLNKLGEI